MRLACQVLRPLGTGLLFLSAPLASQTARRVTPLAEGVYVIEHRDDGDGLAGGNTTVIIGTRQVLVVDTGFLPSEAREDLAQIRHWTDKPVAFVVNTHFHNDHNLGNRVYLDAYPALTIIAQAETKLDMDRYGPGSGERMERGTARLRRLLTTGKTDGGRSLTRDERVQVQQALDRQGPATDAVKAIQFQSATLTFERELTVDLGGREVQIRFLGRGNTSGDAVVYLPADRIVVSGDLVVAPIPFVYDGYPSEWAGTLDRLGALDAERIVPGHGPVLHDKTYLFLMRDLMRSTVDQLNARLTQVGPAMFRTVDDVRGAVDLAPFRPRFAGADSSLGPAFDDMAAQLIALAFAEARLR